MVKIETVFIVFYLLIGIGVAEGLVHFWVNDLNRLSPIATANITLYNGSTLIVSENTDSNGYADLSATTQGLYDFIVRKVGYEDYSSSLSLTTEDNSIVYMRPISTEGIIRLTVVDMTLTNHDFCLYFTDNNRLYECYKLNETATIHNNMNYTMRIKYNKLDSFSSPESVTNLSHFFVPVLFGLGFIFALVVIAYGIFKKLGR